MRLRRDRLPPRAPTPAQRRGLALVEEIAAVCRGHGLSLSPSGSGYGFVITRWSQGIEDILFEAELERLDDDRDATTEWQMKQPPRAQPPRQ